MKATLISVLKGRLPGSFSHEKLLPPGRVLKAASAESHAIKQSSVLLLVYAEKEELKVVLIKRPAHMKHHAGQIALPGGRIEKGESAEETALRETFEEIGIPAGKIEILGKLSPFYVEVSQFQIQPIVGWLSEKPQLKMNPNEVEKTFCFPIKNFTAPYNSIKLETITGKLDVPCILYNEEIIWGATAMILSEFYDTINEVLP